ncbi:MAG: hypothetical protein JWO38_6827 [Gemmataceae bacterium]|nr:hypothetical protein [Gemmataceae bacterium]
MSPLFAGMRDLSLVNQLAFYACPFLCLFGPLLMVMILAIRFRKRNPPPN